MSTKAFNEAFESVKQLAETFQAQEQAYLSPEYKEAEVRKDFIDKFFLALGWDVNHDVQTNPYQQEVKVERAYGGVQRRADYAFYLAPDYRDVRFYVEAKKPSADIAADAYCFQAAQYGYSSKNPLSVLTDFEQFLIIDCRYKPRLEGAHERIYRQYNYRHYMDQEKFADIYWLFSREALAQDSIAKYAAGMPKPRGKATQRGMFPGGYKPVDESLLEDLDEYRTELAHSFKKANPGLDSAELTEITQRTLDRLVFLRFLEDKQIELEPFVDKFGTSGSAWGDFSSVCRRLDSIYNGIIFKRHGILDADHFRLDDESFADICERLCHLNSPYNFHAIPIHILGSIYEQFLGKVIVATAKQVRVDYKPEVRKAGGVYYTPEYIVRYIVENTVGKLIEGKTPDEIAGMRFADIACGSGSILLGVYDLLLRYHGNYYNGNPKKARKDGCVDRRGHIYLPLKKKREILLNNIYGVDIDAQAVEVAQLSLYLRLLQEETFDTVQGYQLAFHETLLPSLAKNIVSGNSLIERDILDGELFSPEMERKFNPMDFGDAFPEVMGRGGFDAIVGNPPYIFTRETITPCEREYYSKKYKLSWEKQNTFMLFMEKLLNLLKPRGLGSLIVPNSWLTIESSKLLRQLYLRQLNLVIDLNYPAFHRVSMEPCIFIVNGGVLSSPIQLARINEPDQLQSVSYHLTERAGLQKHNRVVFHASTQISKLIERILSEAKPLGSLFDVRTGLQAYEKGKGTPPQTASDVTNHVFDRHRRESKDCFCYLEGRDVQRYAIHWSGLWLKYGPWLSQPREIGIFTRPRLLLREITGPSPYCLHYAFVDSPFLNNKSILNILDFKDNRQRLKGLSGVLNSRLMSFYYKQQAVKSGRKIFPKVVIKDLGCFPIPERLVECEHPRIVREVEQIIEAKKMLGVAKTDRDKTYYESKCAALDHQIDRLVYDLYGLTEEEVRIVEKGNN